MSKGNRETKKDPNEIVRSIFKPLHNRAFFNYKALERAISKQFYKNFEHFPPNFYHQDLIGFAIDEGWLSQWKKVGGEEDLFLIQLPPTRKKKRLHASLFMI